MEPNKRTMCCQHFSLVMKESSKIGKCDINNHNNNEAYLIIKKVFEDMHPGHYALQNNECPFFYTGEMEECPFNQKS